MNIRWIFISALFIPTVSLLPQVWQQTLSTPEGSGVTDMVVRQSNQHIFVATGSYNWPNGEKGGISRSTDNGAHWEKVTGDLFIARTIIVGADDNLYASLWPYPSPEGLYMSSDNGNTWSSSALVTVPSGDNIFSIATNATTTMQTIFVGTRNGLLRSTDNGVVWAASNNGIPANSWVRDVEVDSGGYLVAATTNGLFISTNNGELWEQATGIAAGDTIVKLIFDYPLTTEKTGSSTRLLGGSDDGNIYEAFRESQYLFTTLGAIFSTEISAAWVGVLKNLNKKLLGVTTFPKGSFGSGFYSSSDDGVTWQQNNNGLPSNPKTSALSGYVYDDSLAYCYTGLFDNTNGGAKVYYTM